MKTSLTILMALLASTVAMAADLTGRASVIDGDTLEIHGQRIRMHGIDAPESAQTCTINGKPYRCGQRSAMALADKIGARPVVCEGREHDRYRRLIAICRLGKEDLNAWLVSEGLALAYVRYSQDYVGQETAARKARRGLWAGEFMAPWDWRKAPPSER